MKTEKINQIRKILMEGKKRNTITITRQTIAKIDGEIRVVGEHKREIEV